MALLFNWVIYSLRVTLFTEYFSRNDYDRQWFHIDFPARNRYPSRCHVYLTANISNIRLLFKKTSIHKHTRIEEQATRRSIHANSTSSPICHKSRTTINSIPSNKRNRDRKRSNYPLPFLNQRSPLPLPLFRVHASPVPTLKSPPGHATMWQNRKKNSNATWRAYPSADRVCPFNSAALHRLCIACSTTITFVDELNSGSCSGVCVLRTGTLHRKSIRLRERKNCRGRVQIPAGIIFLPLPWRRCIATRGPVLFSQSWNVLDATGCDNCGAEFRRTEFDFYGGTRLD